MKPISIPAGRRSPRLPSRSALAATDPFTARPRLRPDPDRGIRAPDRERYPRRYIEHHAADQRLSRRGKVWTPYVMAHARRPARRRDADRQHRLPGASTPIIPRLAGRRHRRHRAIECTISCRCWDLPSLNLNFRWPERLRHPLRRIEGIYAAAHDRPATTRSPSATDLSLDDIIQRKRRQPFLRPYQAKALDLNIEKYFGIKGLRRAPDLLQAHRHLHRERHRPELRLFAVSRRRLEPCRRTPIGVCSAAR